MPSSTGEQDRPAELLERLKREAVELRSPCGEGSMVWRRWGAGPALVLLHGGYGAWTHWLKNIVPVAERYRVIAPDLPGLGDSAMPPVPYSPESLAAILADGIARLLPGKARFHLVGFSFGALIGGYLAATLGAQVASFTLVGAASLGLPRGKAEPLKPVRSGLSGAALAELQRHNLGILMFAQKEQIDALAVRLQIENVARARVKSRRFAPTDLLAQVLPRIGAPLGGIWGEYDVTAYPHVALRGELLRRLQPAAPFDIIPGAGHWVQYEAADAFNALLLGRLDGVSAEARRDA